MAKRTSALARAIKRASYPPYVHAITDALNGDPTLSAQQIAEDAAKNGDPSRAAAAVRHRELHGGLDLNSPEARQWAATVMASALIGKAAQELADASTHLNSRDVADQASYASLGYSALEHLKLAASLATEMGAAEVDDADQQVQ